MGNSEAKHAHAHKHADTQEERRPRLPERVLQSLEEFSDEDRVTRETFKVSLRMLHCSLI